MSFDPITYSAVQQLKKVSSVPSYEYVWSSRTITVPKNAELTIRAMGAGGAGGQLMGGQGGTVAIKTISVADGDVISVVIPAGGTNSTTAGTLSVSLNGTPQLQIYGGAKGGGGESDDPVGADWFVKGSVSTGSGGGSAMIVEGGTVAGVARGSGGAGALGGSSTQDSGGGGALTNGSGRLGGSGFIPLEMCIFRITDYSGPTEAISSTGYPASNRGAGFGGGGGSDAFGGNGGFGGGGGGGLGPGRGGAGGFGGGGGGRVARSAASGGNGGFGGGGGGGSTNDNGGSGGQGWITLEWRYI